MPTIPIYPPFKEIRIDLYIKDKIIHGTNSFRTLQDFAEFLKDNPRIREALLKGVKEEPIDLKNTDIDLENRI
jgi:hypothetical protein